MVAWTYTAVRVWSVKVCYREQPPDTRLYPCVGFTAIGIIEQIFVSVLSLHILMLFWEDAL